MNPVDVRKKLVNVSKKILGNHAVATTISAIKDALTFPISKEPLIKKVYISDEALLSDTLNLEIGDLDVVMAHEPKTGILFALVKVSEGPAHFYCWRNMQVSTFFIFSGERFQTIEEAVRYVVKDPDMGFEIYKLIVE